MFSNDQWPQQARDALNRFALVQLFRERCNLARGATRGPAGGWSPVELRAPGVGYKLASGQLKPDDLRGSNGFLLGGPTNGLAWVARRTLLDKHELYDCRILGGGDRAIICAAIGRPGYCVTRQAMTGHAAEHYRAWAEPFSADVGGRIGHIEGLALHLWHGRFEDRRYGQRQQDLAARGFDPFTDIAVSDTGCWRWSSGKPDLHDFQAPRLYERLGFKVIGTHPDYPRGHQKHYMRKQLRNLGSSAGQ